MSQPGLVEKIADKRAVPGVLSFSDSMRLLYMNSEAEELSLQIGQARNGHGENEALPPEVLELCQELQDKMDAHPAPKDREQIQLRKVVNDLKFPVLLRGFLIPAPSGENTVRFLIQIGRASCRERV